MPQATWIEFDGKTSSHYRMIEDHVAFNMNAYHRLVQYASRYEKKMGSPKTINPVRAVKAKWAAHQGRKALLAAAAAHVAAAKAMRRAEDIHAGVFAGSAAGGPGGGFDLDG